MSLLSNTLVLEHASCPHAISSSALDGKLYWTDLTFNHIARANLNGTEEEIIVRNVSQSFGLAVDSYGGNIYFTDGVRRTVEVAKLDGSNRKVLKQMPFHRPVALAIDPRRGYFVVVVVLFSY